MLWYYASDLVTVLESIKANLRSVHLIFFVLEHDLLAVDDIEH